MAVPVFGPIALDEVAGPQRRSVDGHCVSRPAAPIKVLIITGDTSATPGRTRPQSLSEILGAGGRIKVDVTTTPSKDLTDENLAEVRRAALELQGYARRRARDRAGRTPTRQAFLKAVREGKGLVVFHHRLERLHQAQLGRVREGDRRRLAVARDSTGPSTSSPSRRPTSSTRSPRDCPLEFEHTIDELYQNSVMVPGSVVLATAYSDPNKPRGTGKDEPVIWVNTYGKGRVYENVLGHDARSDGRPASFRNGCAGE